jgi:hypothetical protein
MSILKRRPERAFGLLFVLLALALLAGCASTSRAEYDREVDFSRYQTFAWAAPERQEVKDPILDSGLLDRRVGRIVRETLTERGFREVDPDEADFLVTYHTTTRDRVSSGGSNVRVHLAYGRGYRYYPHWYDPFYGPYHPYYGPFPARHGPDRRDYREGTLIIDVVDQEREELVWRNWRASEVRQDLFSEKQVRDRVQRILRDFPPQGS